jgi:osmotically-inducible protein OsmY
MKAVRGWSGVLAVAVLALLAYGCENTGRAREQAGETARDAKEQAGKVGEKAEDAAREAGKSLDAAKQTLDIKAALMADKTIDASHIDVDTNAETRTVTLKGTVPSAAQKDAAGRIASDKAEGYTVRNELTVSATP